MDMDGERIVPAPRNVVWDCLNDTDILKQCIPGCERLERESPNELTADVRAKVGPVRALFKGGVTMTDVNPPESYTLQGEGKGAAAGFAKGEAKVKLEEAENDQTRLTYKVHATVGGKLAQVGSRLVEGAAKKYADGFFETFSELAAERAGPVEAAEKPEVAEEAAPAEAPAEAEAGEKRGLHPVIWISGLIIVIAVLLYFLMQ